MYVGGGGGLGMYSHSQIINPILCHFATAILHFNSQMANKDTHWTGYAMNISRIHIHVLIIEYFLPVEPQPLQIDTRIRRFFTTCTDRI